MSLLIAGTGLRIGEALGLRNIDLNLAAEIPYLSVEGTLVEPYEGHPTLEWSPIPKTPNSYRNLALHPAIVDMLLERRKRTKWRRQMDPVFASEQAGTWLWPNNIRTRLRGDVAETEWVGVTPHTLRRGLATVLYYEVGTDLAASALGHAQGGVTHRHYIDRSRRPVIDVRPYVGALLGQGPETPPDARSASKT
ncbi:tyrosine-type recombinase/integrase [Nocardioides ferulae]|uniref:tyrosine-type recombinase/integrase n=1 Tax=Nocardioides ferulae TaxID=2340821 RepID=UPI000F86D6D7|nr:tyrosine-type recombinase/integrase [Nocardioides ferulae]